MRTHIQLLGRFSVRRGGEEIPPSAFCGRLARTLVRVLVTRRGGFVSRDVLVEALWPAHPPADPASNLGVLVNRARKALRDPSLIVTHPGGYSFASDDRCQVDAEVFLARVEAGRAHLAARQAGAALREFRTALDLWAGEPLAEDAYEDWAQAYRAILARAHLDALESGARAAIALRDHDQAVALAEVAVAREPLRETAHLLLVEALANSGDTAAALAAFKAFRQRFADELGLDPPKEALELEERILRGEQLAPRPARPSLAARLPFEQLPFVGREAELDRLVAGLYTPGVVLVTGPSGAGKTRLLAEATAHAEAPVVSARAFQAERDEPWSLVRALLPEILALDHGAAASISERSAQALAAIVPELEEMRSFQRVPLDAESLRILALEGAARLVAAVATRPLVLAVDDLQWADPSSLDLLGSILRRTPTLAAALAYRPEDLEGRAAALIEDLEASGAINARVALEPLPPEAISVLVGDRALAQAIITETDRTPVAVGEVLRELNARGALAWDGRNRWFSRTDEAVAQAIQVARAGRRRAIQARISRHPPSRRELLRLLALVGRESPARVLAAALGKGESRVLDELEVLARAGLVRLGGSGWAPAHDTVAEAATQGLAHEEQGRLHGLLARALQAEGDDPAEVGGHLAAAGDTQGAAEAFREAGRRSLGGFAAEEAERVADAGLALRPRPDLASALLEVRGEARARRGEIGAALGDLREALGTNADRVQRSKILSRIALLTSGAEDYQRASELIDVALAEAGDDPEARGQALLTGAIMDMNIGRPERTEARSTEALALFEGIRSSRGIVDVLDVRAMAAALQGHISYAAALFERAANLFRDLGDLLRMASARANRGYALMKMGRPEESLPDLEEALDAAGMLGSLEAEALALAFRAEALAALGRHDAAAQSAEAALERARKLGHRELIAMSLKALGVVRHAAGDLIDAEAAFHDALREAEGIPILFSWAAAGVASVLLARGELAAAARYVEMARGAGPPVVQFEARLAQVHLALMRGDDDACETAAHALATAEAEGHFVSAARIKELLGTSPATTGLLKGGAQGT